MSGNAGEGHRTYEWFKAKQLDTFHLRGEYVMIDEIFFRRRGHIEFGGHIH